jgi:molecular chaperone HscB
MSSELRSYWDEWDSVVDSGAAQDDAKRLAVRDKMVALLNKRSYIRNLVRDVE